MLLTLVRPMTLVVGRRRAKLGRRVSRRALAEPRANLREQHRPPSYAWDRRMDGFCPAQWNVRVYRGLTVGITQYNKAASGFATDMVWLNDQQSKFGCPDWMRR